MVIIGSPQAIVTSLRDKGKNSRHKVPKFTFGDWGACNFTLLLAYDI
ncbi:hypothetical protein B6N60_05158 [Richelia sinica FACHB-800]|uniref:Uncharacterized protein n=1 Tax=Richelia sinica FACHB-800 TaxID=1357546 RepID=A0A975TEA0_9NOST|nr:hypothetical protein B6N60_05158 [Richelia sinica FACHB-800]